MDKLKPVLAGLQKYHFWVVCLLVVVVGVAISVVATADLANQYAQREKKLKSTLDTVRNISREIDHPNDGIIAALQKAHGEQKGKVWNSWKYLYEKQKKENPWPKPPILSEEFLLVVKSLKPGEPIDEVRYREMYQNFIGRYVPKLFDIVKVRRWEEIDDDKRTDRGAARPAGIGGAGYDQQDNLKLVGKVDWDESDRERILAQFDWPDRPTSLQVWLAQEDIWVYQALLRIIKNTNKGATSHFNASVKRIETIEIGKNASQSIRANAGSDLSGTGQSGGMGAAGMGSPEAGIMEPGGGGMPTLGGLGGGMEPGMGPGAAPTIGGAAGGEPVDIDTVLKEGRYVDEDMKPLAADTEPPYAEFKMMPIRMVLVIDQRKIPELLGECANSSMPVEVRRVLLNPGGGTGLGQLGAGGQSRRPGGLGMEPGAMRPGGGMGPGGGAMPGAMISPGGMGRRPAGIGAGIPRLGGMDEMSRPGGFGRIGGGSTAAEDESSPFDVPVEIQGIIYIYNPPDMAKLGTGTAGEKAPAAVPETPTPAATPAAAPPEVPAPAAPATPAAPVAAPGPPTPEVPRPTEQ
jgi:hypothetical protein